LADDASVLVVGAGPTGLLLAAELHRRGADCLLIEAHSEATHWDRATVVHPRTLEVFESLGIIDPFLVAGAKQRIVRLYSDGAMLGELDLSNCGSRHGYNLNLSEEITESILTDYLHEQGGEVTRSSRLTHLEAQHDGVVARIESDTSREARFDWVVGCDGYRSITRQLVGIELLGHDIPEPWAVFDTTANGWPERYDGNFGFLDALPVIVTALPDRRWRVYLRPSSPDSDLVADATATVARYHPAVTFEDVTNPARFQCHNKVAERFRSGRVLLAGDAAHVCSPAQGHGMNSGIQDAFNLAWKLALVCGGHCSPALLDSYELERRPVAQIITSEGDMAERIQATTDPTARRTRDEGLRRAFTDSALRHHEIIAETELDFDYGASPIVVGDRHGGIRAGERLPDTIAVRLAGGVERPLHEVTNRTGHTALLVGGTSASIEELEDLHASTTAASEPSIVEAVVVAATRADGRSFWASIDSGTAELLGVDGVTLLVVRPDGYVGLRADRDHLEALAGYRQCLGSG